MYFYLYLIKLKLKEIATYRIAFANNILAQLFAYTVTLINLSLLLKEIEVLDGWTYHEITLLWVLNVFSYGITGLFFYKGCNRLETEIQYGTFDIYYLQPVKVFWNYMFQNINPLFVLHICFSSTLLIRTLSTLQINFTFFKCFYFGVLLLCSVSIQSCIMIIFATLSFKVIKANNIVNTAIYGFRNFTTYPFSIYGKGIRYLLTFFIPYAFVSYYPAMFLLNKETYIYEIILIYSEPLLAIGIVLVTVMVWKKGLKVYNGTGC